MNNTKIISAILEESINTTLVLLSHEDLNLNLNCLHHQAEKNLYPVYKAVKRAAEKIGLYYSVIELPEYIKAEQIYIYSTLIPVEVTAENKDLIVETLEWIKMFLSSNDVRSILDDIYMNINVPPYWGK